MPKQPTNKKASFAPPGYMVRRLREWWEWDTKELAKNAGLPHLLVSRIEHNRADPCLSELQKLATALKVKVIMLLDNYTPLLWVDESDRERLWKRVIKGDPEECWRWIGAKDPKTSYGKIHINGKNEAPYRAVYAMTAPLPAHWQIDHTCNNRWCVNPEHLKAVTGGRNTYNRDIRREQEKLAKEYKEFEDHRAKNR